MINQSVLHGFIKFDVELKHTKDNKEYIINQIAVRRNFKNDQGKYGYDDIPIVAYGERAVMMSRFCKKGDLVCIQGRNISNRFSYKDEQSNEKTITTSQICVEAIDFDHKTKKAEEPTKIIDEHSLEVNQRIENNEMPSKEDQWNQFLEASHHQDD